MKLNTIIELPDGRIGTICWNHLDGAGGVFGEHHFVITDGSSFSDDLPAPEFMLREKVTKDGFELEKVLRNNHRSNIECVGEKYKIISILKEEEIPL